MANNINTSNNTVTSTMIPLYQVGAGAGQGDSGGPASMVKDNSRYLIGCSSWGEFPKDQKPTIYTDLYDFRNWISNIVPLPNLIGNNIICSTPNTTFTLNNENATSWQVSSNLQILNSSDTTITVKPNVSYTTTGWIKAIFSTGIFITKNINLNNPVININDISLMDENYNSINGSGTYDDPFIVCSNKSYILGGNSQLDMSDMNNITLPSGWSGYSYGAIQIFFTTGDFSGSQDNIIIDYEGVCGSSYHRVYFALNGDCSSGYYRYSIVPNPITTGQLNIISKNDKENKKGKQKAKTLVEFLVFDYQGIQLNSKKDNNNKTSYQLNVSHLNQGIYYLKIITESHSEVHKILIEQ